MAFIRRGFRNDGLAGAQSHLRRYPKGSMAEHKDLAELLPEIATDDRTVIITSVNEVFATLLEMHALKRPFCLRQRLYRVPHSVKGTGKNFIGKDLFTECFLSGTRQRMALGKEKLS
jgi:hypothetical protein